MTRSHITNLIMAVGLVMIYFFIDGLSIDLEKAFLRIRARENFHAVEAHEISTAKVSDVNGSNIQIENHDVNFETIDEAIVDYKPVDQVESQGFYVPTQAERPNLISPLGEAAPLAEIPLRLIIPVINLDAPILGVSPETISIDGMEFQQWLSPDEFAAGWHETSAMLGDVGNTVLNGHHNINGEIFRRLIELIEGDKIIVFSDQHLFTYQITNKMILPEMYEPLEVRVQNAQWIMPSQDERLTLITCWPYESNTHRLIIVAKPISVEAFPDIDQELIPRILDENR